LYYTSIAAHHHITSCPTTLTVATTARSQTQALTHPGSLPALEQPVVVVVVVDHTSLSPLTRHRPPTRLSPNPTQLRTLASLPHVSSITTSLFSPSLPAE